MDLNIGNPEINFYEYNWSAFSNNTSLELRIYMSFIFNSSFYNLQNIR